MTDKRPKIQMPVALMTEIEGEAQTVRHEGNESATANRHPEPPTPTTDLMEAVLERENLKQALRRVMKNAGSPGVDGMTVTHLPDYLKAHWPMIKEQLQSGSDRPQPVQRVEIPKPNGGIRNLGIPTVLDRFVQQAILQVLQPQWEATFSDFSFGFRPGRSAHQAIAQAQRYRAQGYGVVVDLDLEKFFDRVQHDKLMGLVAKRITDKRVLKLIRGFLTAGVMIGGLTSPTVQGTPQGGPLSPLLSNLLLDELDQELEKRGLRFCRYADDCNIYVKSRRAGERVMTSISRFITTRLKLSVNREKSAVGSPSHRPLLGFCIGNWTDQATKRRIAPPAIRRFKQKVRSLTRRINGKGLRQTLKTLSAYLRGWKAYFGFCQTPSVLKNLDSWIRRRLRSLIWKHWKTFRNRFAQLGKRGVTEHLAAGTAGSSQGAWALSRSKAVLIALPNRLFQDLGLPSLAG